MRSPFDKLVHRALIGFLEWRAACQCQKRRETMLRSPGDFSKAATKYERELKRHGRTRSAIAAMQRATTEMLRQGVRHG